MKINEDVTKHLFYSAWILLFLQMGKVIGSTILTLYYPNILNIIDAAYNCALILFSIGLLRLGLEVEGLRFWKASSMVLIAAALVDITTLILSYIFRGDAWFYSPLIFVRLPLILSYLIFLTVGYTLVKFLIDELFKQNIVNQKGKFSLSVGFTLLLIPYIISWYGDYLLIQSVQHWIYNLGLFFFLLASFLVIIGYMQLGTSMKMMGADKVFVEVEKEKEQQTSEGEVEKEVVGENN